jgi:hypothetical protein
LAKQSPGFKETASFLAVTRIKYEETASFLAVTRIEYEETASLRQAQGRLFLAVTPTDIEGMNEERNHH